MSYMTDMMKAYNLIDNLDATSLSAYHQNLIQTVINDIDTLMDDADIKDGVFDDDKCGDCQFLVRTLESHGEVTLECGQDDAEFCPVVADLHL